MDETTPDPRSLERDICGVIEIGPTGIEWICINKDHNPGYKRKAGDATHRRGAIVYATGGRRYESDWGFSAPKADRHHFVNRWPNRPKESE